ncbi:microfibril-associated glycoprotein 4-like [Sabethes cyaneus]|uniref:microfibril-associated glycoprotein 4-like n=1 Tax=Sabethes cyaneus TaxID=53552 RepID=UPI00237DD521|nr:microfibril-associated glycoprotein 4-like [Sabethes cyaneus]
MIAKFVLLPVLVAVAAIINTSTAESNESISNPAFGYELLIIGLDENRLHTQQNSFTIQELNSNLQSLKKSVAWIEKLVKKSLPLPETCAEISDHPSGLYHIRPQTGFSDVFEVYCDQKYEGGGWLVIQNRYDGSVDFFRGWKEYEAGFGDLHGEFWLGLEKIHKITTAKPYELRIVLEDFDGKVATARYDRFTVGGAETKYVLSTLGNYSGTAGDSLRSNAEMKFSTFDSNNDRHNLDCAANRKGAWWYNECSLSNLNGLYLKGKQPLQNHGTMMCWGGFRGCGYGLKRSRMMIKVLNN